MHAIAGYIPMSGWNHVASAAVIAAHAASALVRFDRQRQVEATQSTTSRSEMAYGRAKRDHSTRKGAPQTRNANSAATARSRVAAHANHAHAGTRATPQM